MGLYQLALERLFLRADGVAAVMRMHWSWPAAESLHFIGLTLLFGSIAVWDLRLMGMVSRIPIAAFHRLVPFAMLGFAINAASGSLFLMTEPNQYFFNPAFHLKMMFIALAGLNVLVFYLTIFRRVRDLGPGAATPPAARIIGAVSLLSWIGVIVCGRMLTFFRPYLCQPGEAIAFLATCIVR